MTRRAGGARSPGQGSRGGSAGRPGGVCRLERFVVDIKPRSGAGAAARAELSVRTCSPVPHEIQRPAAGHPAAPASHLFVFLRPLAIVHRFSVSSPARDGSLEVSSPKCDF